MKLRLEPRFETEWNDSNYKSTMSANCVVLREVLNNRLSSYVDTSSLIVFASFSISVSSFRSFLLFLPFYFIYLPLEVAHHLKVVTRSIIQTLSSYTLQYNLFSFFFLPLKHGNTIILSMNQG